MSVAGHASRLARRWGWLLGSLGGCCLSPSVALAQAGSAVRAEPPALTLVWTGPGPELSCLGEEGLARSVNEYLGRDAFASGPAELVLHVNVERQADRTWHALLELRDASGTVLGSRSLASSDSLCSSLNDPLTLAVALMVGSEPEPVAPEPPRAPEPERPPLPPSPPAHASERRPVEFGADGSALFQAGLLPAPSFGLELGFELRLASWLAGRLSGRVFVPAHVELEAGAAARFWLAHGDLALCPRGALARRWELAGCAGMALGALFAESHGLEAARSTSRRFLGVTLDLRASFRLGRRSAIFWQFGGTVPIQPDRFFYEVNGARTEFFRVAAFAPVAAIGGSVLF